MFCFFFSFLATSSSREREREWARAQQKENPKGKKQKKQNRIWTIEIVGKKRRKMFSERTNGCPSACRWRCVSLYLHFFPFLCAGAPKFFSASSFFLTCHSSKHDGDNDNDERQTKRRECKEKRLDRIDSSWGRTRTALCGTDERNFARKWGELRGWRKKASIYLRRGRRRRRRRER